MGRGCGVKGSILVLFNKLYNASLYSEIWSTGVIVPIYKIGDPKQPANYRGITLTSTMSTLFTYILKQRLRSWFEQSRAASQAQFAVFVLSLSHTSFTHKKGSVPLLISRRHLILLTEIYYMQN